MQNYITAKIKSRYSVRKAEIDEFKVIGQLTLQSYQNEGSLVGAVDQVSFQRMLADIGELALLPSAHIFVAVLNDCIVGTVLYFENLNFYGLGRQHLSIHNTAGIRFLTVRPGADQEKIALLLISHCVKIACCQQQIRIITHCTLTMEWQRHAYQEFKFKPCAELDYRPNRSYVLGFQLSLVVSTREKARAFLRKWLMGVSIRNCG